MILELLKHPKYIRILALLKNEPLTVSSIRNRTKCSASEIERVLRLLLKGLWIIPETVATKSGKIPVRYRIGKKGRAFLDAFDTFVYAVEQHEKELGTLEIENLRKILRT